VRRVATIGVYGASGDAFLACLREAEVEQVLDVRQRRGVRGAEYAWANAARLEQMLYDAHIDYRHHLELAPTTDLRHLQYAEDDRQGVGKRSRVELAPAYRDGYLAQILDAVDLTPIVEAMPRKARAALLCVERDPEACHRSLIAARLASEFGCEIVHLRPSDGEKPDL
jgi:uncharacterized protein (DUF488 family)